MVALPRTLSAEETRTPFASGHVPELGTVVGLTSGGVPRDQDSTFGFLAFRDLVLSHTGLLSGKLGPALPLPSGFEPHRPPLWEVEPCFASAF
eukprot:Cvel_34554.t1-p1 / transcript=Cvel_34554.t1 / gene=Cvel_34554 / organism=Chromera_velia_CCMP2878 / gene_product=hypothetical protein / transcript_product=hypothetical protein / location=Cvel_scaffold5977:3024-3702(+) / protein_length=92 / sequence_SO=supercontig / SO=protein_coding / is_pseudo=false